MVFIPSLANFSNVGDYMKDFTHARQVIDHWSTSSASLNRITISATKLRVCENKPPKNESLPALQNKCLPDEIFFYFFSRLLFITSQITENLLFFCGSLGEQGEKTWSMPNVCVYKNVRMKPVILHQ